MKGKVVISLPIDCVNEDDAKNATIGLLARAMVLCTTQRACREWIREHAEIRFVPASEGSDGK